MEYYRNVTTKSNSLFTKEKPNMAVYAEQSKQLREERAAKEKAALENAQLELSRKKEAADKAKASRVMLEGYKRNMVSKLHVYVPLAVMNETFNRIVTKALPHDEDYIEAIAPKLEMFNMVYLHHLGGFKYLKEQAMTTKNPFLMKWYKMVKENSEAIIKDKIDQIQDAESEEDVAKIVKGGIDADQAEKINNDIEDMSTDDIAELVQNKVLDVVKDESERQAKDAALRQELANRAKEYEDQNNEELGNNVANGEADDQNDEVEPEEGKNETDTNEDEESEAEEPQEENFKLGKYLLDPTILHETTLFYSMMYATQAEMIRSVKEDSNDVGTVVNPKVPTKVLTSPLNLNLFDVYLSDYQNDLADVDSLRVSNKNPIAGDETRIESEDVLAEALVKYTILESAMTIHLINPDWKEVKAVAEYNMAWAKRK